MQSSNRLQRRSTRDDGYFERFAADLWDGDWDAIVAIGNADDRERLFVEAMILCRYGRSLSLRGAPDKVRNVLARARGDVNDKPAQRSIYTPSTPASPADHLTIVPAPERPRLRSMLDKTTWAPRERWKHPMALLPGRAARSPT